MNREQGYKQKILIADDSEMNRAILTDMLENEYHIIEAEDGMQALAALQTYETEISLVLLDIVMPRLDGFGVLKVMNQRRWIEDIPVIMISSESSASHIDRAFEMGITDFISRPFGATIVHRRVVNTIFLYAKQKKLVNLVADQIYEKEQQNNLMINILSHIVEFRNGESGLHVLHIHILTELLLKHLIQITDRYPLSRSDISLISTASALHDIGKISIPSEILNKPGRLTEEEFTVMKTHSMRGALMLDELPIHKNEPLVKTAYEICRWHHERYDGRGYPDGLKGDNIPISAQIVALADVYDALTSERVYKKAFSHETAVRMILDGQCGAFNPLLMQCLQETEMIIQEALTNNNRPAYANQIDMEAIMEEMMRHEELASTERSLQLLEHERMKYNFFSAMSNEIQFEYIETPSMVTLSPWGAEKLGLPEMIMEPHHDSQILAIFSKETLQDFSKAIRSTTPSDPVIHYDCQATLGGASRWFRVISRATWSSDETPQYLGAIGKAVDIHEARLRFDMLLANVKDVSDTQP
ncbi:MAG: response regulator [Lachnospiraceae bacterium]|nr:response regulator [Lachnospiraceae bacterium]